MRMLFDELLHPGDIFEKHPIVIKIYDMFAMAIHPDYRGRGHSVRFQQFFSHILGPDYLSIE